MKVDLSKIDTVNVQTLEGGHRVQTLVVHGFSLQGSALTVIVKTQTEELPYKQAPTI